MISRTDLLNQVVRLPNDYILCIVLYLTFPFFRCCYTVMTRLRLTLNVINLFATVADDAMEIDPQTLLKSFVSSDQLTSIAELVKDKWENLAAKFSTLDPDEINYFKAKETPLLQATNMLTVWKVSDGILYDF